MAVYGPYRYLFAKDTEGIITKFISRERPLQDYVAAIERLKKMASEIASLPVYVPMHLFLLDCSKLNQVNEINSCGCLYFSQLFKRKFIIKYCIVSDSQHTHRHILLERLQFIKEKGFFIIPVLLFSNGLRREISGESSGVCFIHGGVCSISPLFAGVTCCCASLVSQSYNFL